MFQKLEDGIGLAVSGGGFRATLFHLGAFWRLNELGYLKKLSRICSVSGGSITAAMLGLKWSKLNFNEQGVADNFEKEVVKPLRAFCATTIDVPSILGGWLSFFKSPGDLLTKRYDRLFRGATLNDLPDRENNPHFVIYATNLQTGASFRLSRPYMADYRISTYNNPGLPIAQCVAASSACPPVLTPIMLETDPNKWEEDDKGDLFDQIEMRREIYLTDGGVYDNLGLENIWHRYKTVLVSDAGAPFETKAKPWMLKFSQVKKTIRVMDILINQTRALRKRQLITNYKNPEAPNGAYWGITTEIDKYKLDGAMVRDNTITRGLQSIRTRLDSFTPEEQGRLINWGYALADTAMRRHVIETPMTPGKWPVEKYRLDK